MDLLYKLFCIVIFTYLVFTCPRGRQAYLLKSLSIFSKTEQLLAIEPIDGTKGLLYNLFNFDWETKK